MTAFNYILFALESEDIFKRDDVQSASDTESVEEESSSLPIRICNTFTMKESVLDTLGDPDSGQGDPNVSDLLDSMPFTKRERTMEKTSKLHRDANSGNRIQN